MRDTPLSSRRHVAIFGDTNAGKSSLFNAITGQETMIVSAERGTTTDPVVKAMELIPFGPIALIDTAGLKDETNLGGQRVRKTMGILARTDLAIFAADINEFDKELYESMKNKFMKNKIPHILVFTKCDLCDAEAVGAEKIQQMRREYPEAFFTAINDKVSIEELKAGIGRALEKIGIEEDSIISGLVPEGGVVVMVVPVDSEAPKGRLILPQVQLIRDCLDHGIACVVTRDIELEATLARQQRVDLVVTDSQAFAGVSKIVTESVPLTSFSMLLARQKGDLDIFLGGIKAIRRLRDGSRILIAEACTHTTSHEDIGKVKIPNGLKKFTGKDLRFEFRTGHDFPEDLTGYDLVVHCGACMINKKAVGARIARCAEQGIPVTNYGVLLAYMTGILQRCSGPIGGEFVYDEK